MPDDVRRDPLAEIGLEAVDALVEQCRELRPIPFAGFRVGEVHDAHARLPLVALPRVATWAPNQVAGSRRLVEQRRRLSHVGIDPDADAQAALVEPGQHTHRVGEDPLVPGEVDPLELAHPEGIEMEDAEGNIPLGHPLDEARNGGFVVVGGE